MSIDKHNPAPEKATSDSWNVVAMPESANRLPFERLFTPQEYECLSVGLIPSEMEDKWFIFAEGDELFFHRSWTGFCIYRLRVQRQERGYSVAEAWVNRDQSQYRSTDDEYDAAMLGYLVDSLLLEKRVPFPVPEGLPEAALNGFYQHHIVGRAYSRAGVQTKASLLERLRRFIGKS